MKYIALAAALLLANSDSQCTAMKVAPPAKKPMHFAQMESDSESSSSDDDEEVALKTQVRIGSFKPDIAELTK